jgi:transposase-like protein
MAVVIAYGVRSDGVREVLGVDLGLSEDVALWRAFLQGLVGRGLAGVRLVISDAHTGLKQAIREVFVPCQLRNSGCIVWSFLRFPGPAPFLNGYDTKPPVGGSRSIPRR